MAEHNEVNKRFLDSERKIHIAHENRLRTVLDVMDVRFLPIKHLLEMRDCAIIGYFSNAEAKDEGGCKAGYLSVFVECNEKIKSFLGL